jgi:hypothetical protein
MQLVNLPVQQYGSPKIHQNETAVLLVYINYKMHLTIPIWLSSGLTNSDKRHDWPILYMK